MREVEILAPAGSLEGLYAALRMGADAVYVGTTRFGARAFADNPSVEELAEALTYAHLRKKKIYLTVNTLLTDAELEELYAMIRPLYEAGLDACIVQDMGVLKFLHECFPGMELHASTQMTLFSGEEANLLKPYGVTRYVPARELTIEEIREARRQTDMEIEVFVHGALCYCYSGQCLMSQVIGGRSGNRGMCAQPCRLSMKTPYGEGYFLSTKDICTLMHIPELVDAGIDSFKIEGRMKKKEYSMYLSQLYRKYVDIYQSRGAGFFEELVEDKGSELWRDYRRCADIYNRGGFSDSFLFEKEKKQMVYPSKNGHFGVRAGEVIRVSRGQAVFRATEEIHYQDVLEFRGEDDTKAYEYTSGEGHAAGSIVTANTKKGSRIYLGQAVYRTRNAALQEQIRQEHEEKRDSYGLKGIFTGKIGEPARLQIEGNGVRVTAEGGEIVPAEKRPVDWADIESRLNRLGGTPYHWAHLTVEMEPGGFLALGGLKELRRRAVAEWEQQAVPRRILQGRAPRLPETADLCLQETADAYLSGNMDIISVSDLTQLRAVLKYAGQKVIPHLKLEDLPSEDWKKAASLLHGRRMALSFPRILHGAGRKSFEEEWERQGEVFAGGMVSVIMVNSFVSYLYADQYFPKAVRIADNGLYQMNCWARAAYLDFGILPPPETVYGRIPVMVTESCLAATLSLCGRKDGGGQGTSQLSHSCGKIPFCTPKGDKFVVVNHCKYCYNTIYTDKPARCSQSGEACRRIDFTWEQEDEVRRGIREWNF